jgi:hypothetical protein
MANPWVRVNIYSTRLVSLDHGYTAKHWSYWISNIEAIYPTSPRTFQVGVRHLSAIHVWNSFILFQCIEFELCQSWGSRFWCSFRGPSIRDGKRISKIISAKTIQADDLLVKSRTNKRKISILDCLGTRQCVVWFVVYFGRSGCTDRRLIQRTDLIVWR